MARIQTSSRSNTHRQTHRNGQSKIPKRDCAWTLRTNRAEDTAHIPINTVSHETRWCGVIVEATARATQGTLPDCCVWVLRIVVAWLHRGTQQEVEDEDELDCDSNQDPVFQSPKETGKKCCKARNEVKLCNEKRRTLISRISDCTNLI